MKVFHPEVQAPRSWNGTKSTLSVKTDLTTSCRRTPLVIENSLSQDTLRKRPYDPPSNPLQPAKLDDKLLKSISATDSLATASPLSATKSCTICQRPKLESGRLDEVAIAWMDTKGKGGVDRVVEDQQEISV
ncbi:uncharacterized protein IAS62_006453 [Cryptococcus decagattii]|uniref:Uncharacterized protein n=1 Tax=Cryptococcus decagattii TaxID=1859122 RepID=A0ABZ2B6M1_9TREE